MYTSTNFPRDAIGLDTWANVHMIHKKTLNGGAGFDHELTLAHGTCKCRREVGRKGIPRVYVPWSKKGDNIDLFPEGFLWNRGCTITRGDQHILQTPKGRVFPVRVWGENLSYISKADLQKVIDDLPDDTQAGRFGNAALTPTAARVCMLNQECLSGQIRKDLKHLREEMSKQKFANVCSKYRSLPDTYYGGDQTKVITPDKWSNHCATRKFVQM